jgi:hypothetical protein
VRWPLKTRHLRGESIFCRGSLDCFDLICGKNCGCCLPIVRPPLGVALSVGRRELERYKSIRGARAPAGFGGGGN